MDARHLNVCEAPICSCDTEPGWKVSVKWYPGEDVCPRGRAKWQVNQRRINKLYFKGLYKDMGIFYTVDQLEQMQRVRGFKTSSVAKKQALNHRRGRGLTPSPYQTTTHA